MLQPDSRDLIVKIIMLVQLFNLAPAPLDGSYAFKKDLSHDPRGLWERWKVSSYAWLLLKLHLSGVHPEKIFASLPHLSHTLDY